ncbi:unnamed protein product [Kluyveromyces dobzhanskii CBS 2104]|uniref:WGS project CCBQ000000000 data, contig 00099 n=1 Tax=Kluyveromyces dobzhanskii CBS 2104 TaxID=1427455 RepID=A0A0A8L1V6_9SACH|nr:unnamed protein product [Kluyveromyces dobzhanskii CBS 2104]
MSDRQQLYRFEKSLTAKSFRRYESPLTRKRINLLEHKQSNGNNQLIKYKKPKNESARKLLSYETEDTVSLMQSLIKKGKDLLASVSKEEKSLQNELEANVRNEQLRLQYIEELIGGETKELHHDCSTGSAVSAELNAEFGTKPQLLSESEDSIIILSDNEEQKDIELTDDEKYPSNVERSLTEDSVDYSEGDSVVTSEQPDSSIPDITMQDHSQADNNSNENNDLLHEPSEVVSSEHSNEPTSHLKSTFTQGSVPNGSLDLDVSARSDSSDSEVESEKVDIPFDNYYTNSEENEEDFIIPEQPDKYRGDSGMDSIASQSSEDENFDENNGASIDHSSEPQKPTEVDSDSHRNDSGVYQASDEVPTSDYKHEPEQNQIPNVEHSEDKQQFLQTSTLSDELTTIASQALAQLNAGTNIYEHSRDMMKEEAEPSEQNSPSYGEEYFHEQEIISEENHSSSEDSEAVLENDDSPSQSDHYKENSRSDGVGELGEYSYQSDMTNNVYGLITDNDHSILLKTLEQSPASDNYDSIQENKEDTPAKYPDSNLDIADQNNIAFDLYTKDASETPNIETSVELIKDVEISKMEAKQESLFSQQMRPVCQAGPKYTLTFSDSFSDEDNPQLGPKDEENANPVYQSAFSVDPFDSKSEGSNNEKSDLNELLTVLGYPALQKSEPCEVSDIAQPSLDHINVATPPREASVKEQTELESFDNGMHNTSAEIFHDAVLFQSPLPNREESDQNQGSSDVSPENGAENSPALTDSLTDEGKTKIPLFIDKETIRLATSPIRPPCAEESVDDSSIPSDEAKMMGEFSPAKGSLEFQGSLSPHDIPIFNLNSVNITGNRSPVRMQGLQSTLERASAEHIFNNKTKDAQIADANSYPALSSDFSSNKRSVPEIKIPLFVHRGESHEVASPFEDRAQTKTSTELSDYVESVMNEPTKNENQGPIITEPLDVQVHTRSVSFIEVEELVSEDIKDIGIEKILTEPEISLSASPELIQDTVELEELVFEQASHLEVESTMESESVLKSNPTLNEVTTKIGETIKIKEQIESKISESIESAQYISKDASAIMNKPLLCEKETLSENAVQGEINSESNEIMDETSDLSDTTGRRVLTFSSSSMKQVHGHTLEESNTCKTDAATGNNSNIKNSLKESSLPSLANAKESDNNDVSKDPLPKPSFGKTILSSPLKVWHNLARGVKSIGDAATEFVGAVGTVEVDSDVHSTHSDQSGIESEMSESQSDAAAVGDIETININTKQTELKPPKFEAESAEPQITDLYTTLQTMESITNRIEDPQNTYDHEESTQQISRSIPSDVLVDNTIELSLAMSPSNSGTINHEATQTPRKEASIPIDVKSEEQSAADIPVTIGSSEPLQQRTPVKKRPRSTDTSVLKSSKRKQKKKRRRARITTSVARNLRSKSKK